MSSHARVRPRVSGPVLLVGPTGSDHLHRVFECLKGAGIESRYDADGDASQPLRQLALVMVDLDGAGNVLERLRLIRIRRPDVPIVAVIENPDLAVIVGTGSLGIQGAIRLPARGETVLKEVFRWVAPPAQPTAAPQRMRAATGGPRNVRSYTTAKYMAYSSAASQALLQGLAAARDQRIIQVTGRPGAEFGLLAREFAHLCSLDESAVHDAPTSPLSTPSVLVTRDPAAASESAASRVILIVETPDGTTTARHAEVCLNLAPLGSRPMDVASYVYAWLPLVATCVGRAVSELFPLPEPLRAVILGNRWEGEFSELVGWMHRIALTGTRAALRELTKGEEGTDPFEALIHGSAPREFRAKVEPRVPAHLRTTVLSALGFTESLSA